MEPVVVNTDDCESSRESERQSLDAVSACETSKAGDTSGSAAEASPAQWESSYPQEQHKILQASAVELRKEFKKAESLCEASQHDASLPRFLHVLSQVQGQSDPELRRLEAEIQAYLGVAFQSVGQVQDAVDAYTSAVEIDPALHVCHGNLASLHSYLRNERLARKHLTAALERDPANPAYLKLRDLLDTMAQASSMAPSDVPNHRLKWT